MFSPTSFSPAKSLFSIRTTTVTTNSHHHTQLWGWMGVVFFLYSFFFSLLMLILKHGIHLRMETTGDGWGLKAQYVLSPQVCFFFFSFYCRYLDHLNDHRNHHFRHFDASNDHHLTSMRRIVTETAVVAAGEGLDDWPLPPTPTTTNGPETCLRPLVYVFFFPFSFLLMRIYI